MFAVEVFSIYLSSAMKMLLHSEYKYVLIVECVGMLTGIRDVLGAAFAVLFVTGWRGCILVTGDTFSKCIAFCNGDWSLLTTHFLF